MEMTGRSVGSEYKYGMNGQMKENAVFEGFMSADFWGYDARLGRRWNTDPIVKPWESPYMCFSNNPIYFADPLGLSSSTVTPKGTSDAGAIVFPLNKDGKGIDLEEIPVTPSRDALSSAPTYATSIPRLSPDILDFSVASIGAEVGVIGSINPSLKEYLIGDNPKKLYSRTRLWTRETDVVMGTGASVGIDFGYGTFNNVKPFENPFQRILDASDADVGAQYGFVRAAYNTGDGTYSYFTIGAGYGFGEKQGQLFEQIGNEMPPIIGNNPFSVGGGIHDPVVLYMSRPTILDSIRTSLNNRGDSTAEAFLKRNPNIIPKSICITCK